MNIVICCDGTNNSLRGCATNVVFLNRLTTGIEPQQMSFYDAGVGTLALPGLRSRVAQEMSRWAGAAFGYGLLRIVERAYVTLVDNYKPGDRVFLFGFSRGAFAVRMLAGVLYRFGLLDPSERSYASEVVDAYQRLCSQVPSSLEDVASDESTARPSARTKLGVAGIPCPVHFLGLFDTVSSVGWAWDPQSFPNTARMPGVQRIRHCLALDERRAKFRPNRVVALPDQDLREVWFAGSHADVGGGYAPPLNRLSRVPLNWMVREARKAG